MSEFVREFDESGTEVDRRRLWRKPDGTPWFRHWMGDPLVIVTDQQANARQEARIVKDEEGAEVERYRRRVRRSLEDVLGTPNGNEVVTLTVALGLVTPKQARRAGWTPPGV